MNVQTTIRHDGTPKPVRNSRSFALSQAFCHLVRKYDITLPSDPSSQESADWVIGL